MITGCTASRDGLTDAQWDRVDEMIWKLDSSELHQGCCDGGDEEITEIAHAHGFKIIGHPPNNDKHLSAKAVELSDELWTPKPYLERNRNIVDECDVLIACPATSSMPDSLKGQGTWSTVAYALKQEKPMLVILPTGRIEKHFWSHFRFRSGMTLNYEA